MKLTDIQTYLNKILVFYYPEKAGYWNSLTKCCITERPDELAGYYLDFSTKAFYPYQFSDDGIPLFTHGKESKIEQPVVIAQYALGLSSLLAKDNFDNKELEKKFINIANWFVKNREQVKNGVGWFIKTPYPHYGLNTPWISAMAQGEAISVITRAARISKVELYEQIAIDALVPFEYNVVDGGLVNHFNSIPVYEELPTTSKTMAVLNGFIFALFGLYDLYLLNKNKKALSLFNSGIESLLKLLPYYNFNFWSNYFLYDYPKKYYSSYTYHILVTEQLKVLHILTNESLFNEYAIKWDEYSKSFIKKNIALFQKIFFSNKINP